LSRPGDVLDAGEGVGLGEAVGDVLGVRVGVGVGVGFGAGAVAVRYNAAITDPNMAEYEMAEVFPPCW
jgi:hypothetical protein